MPYKRVNSKSIKFGPNGDKVVIGDVSDFTFTDNAGTDKPFSVSSWVFIRDVSLVSGAFFSKRHKANLEGEYYFGHEGGKIIAVLYADPAQNGVGAFNTMNRIYFAKNAFVGGLQDETWHNITVTYSGNKSHTGVNIYLDGTALVPDSATTNNYNGMGNEAAPVTIGGTDDPDTNVFEDFIADTMVFNKELTATEVQEVYNQGKVKDMTQFTAYSNLLSWYKMGDDLDTPDSGGIRDYVGSNHGTLAGSAYIAASPELGTDQLPVANHHLYTTHGRTRQITNAAGAFGSAIATPTAAPTLASDGYDTQNQRFAHIVINTFPIDEDNNSSFIVYGYNHAFGKWAVLRRHASGFKNIYVNEGTDDFRLQHSQNTRPCTRYVLEIAGIDRIYIQADAGAGNAATDQVFLGFNTF